METYMDNSVRPTIATTGSSKQNSKCTISFQLDSLEEKDGRNYHMDVPLGLPGTYSGLGVSQT